MTFTYVSLIAVLLLLLIPGYLLYAYDRSTLQKACLAIVRMAVQLAVMGACLWAVYHYDSPWLTLLWIILTALAATFIMVSRTKIGSATLLMPVGVSMLLTVLLFTAYVLFGVLQPVAPLSACWAVPVAGVLMAHVLTTNLPALRTFFDCIQQDPQPYNTLTGNGATRLKALAPYITRALRSLLMPAMASMSALGLFIMPMLLSGLLLGGLPAIEAVACYAALVVAGVAAATTALMLTLWLLSVNKKPLA